MFPHRPAERAAQHWHREIIDTVSEYYRFLTRLPHVDPNSLVFPPPGGWTTINENELKARGRTEEAIRIIRQLPYLRNADLPRPMKSNITNDSLSIAYCDGELEPAYVHQQQPTPGHIIWLATQSNREGSYLLLDICSGTITTWNPIYPGPPLPDILDEDSLEPIDRWMNYATLPVREFFDLCKRRYERLIWIPVPGLRMNNSCGTAHYYERILYRRFQDDYLYSDDEYVATDDGSGSASDDVLDEADTNISEREVDELMSDADSDGRRFVEEAFSHADLSSDAIPSATVDWPGDTDVYDTDVAYEDLPTDMKQTWLETKDAYFIYMKCGWPSTDYDRATCTQQLQDFLEARRNAT